MSQWYYSRNGEKFGPLSSEQLKQLAASGQLFPTDLIWKEGMKEWQPAVKVKGLFPEPSETPPPPPPIAKLYTDTTPPGPFSTRQPIAKSSPFANIAVPFVVIVTTLLFCFPIGLVLVWIQSKWTKQRKVKWTIATAVCYFVLMTLATIVSSVEQAEADKNVATANALWDQGDQAAAVEIYKDAASLTSEENKPTVYGRIIDYEADQGNDGTVRQYWKKMKDDALIDPIYPNCKSEKAKILIANLEREEAEKKAVQRQAKETENTSGPSKAEQSASSFEVSKGLLSGSMTVELSPEIEDEISISNASCSFGTVKFIIHWKSPAYRGSVKRYDPWGYTAYDENDVQIDGGSVVIPGEVSLGDKFEGRFTLRSEDVSKVSRIVIRKNMGRISGF